VFRVTVLYLAVSNWPIPHTVVVGHTHLTLTGGDSVTDDFSHGTYVPIIINAMNPLYSVFWSPAPASCGPSLPETGTHHYSLEP